MSFYPTIENNQNQSYGQPTYPAAPQQPPQPGQQPGQQQSFNQTMMNRALQAGAQEVREAFDSQYFKTIPGCLSTLAVCSSALAYITSSANQNSYAIFTLISGFAFWVSLIFLLIHLFHINDKITNVPWIPIELLYYVAFTMLYFLSTFIMLFSHIALGLFALICTLVFAYSTYIKLKEYQTLQMEQQTANSPSMHI